MIYFVNRSLIRTLKLRFEITFARINKKKSMIYFVNRSLIRNFAPAFAK